MPFDRSVVPLVIITQAALNTPSVYPTMVDLPTNLKNYPKDNIQPAKKEKRQMYCTHFIRHGRCGYRQQGCKYKHEMPDEETKMNWGFKTSFSKGYRQQMISHNNSSETNLQEQTPKVFPIQTHILINQNSLKISRDLIHEETRSNSNITQQKSSNLLPINQEFFIKRTPPAILSCPKNISRRNNANIENKQNGNLFSIYKETPIKKTSPSISSLLKKFCLLYQKRKN